MGVGGVCVCVGLGVGGWVGLDQHMCVPPQHAVCLPTLLHWLNIFSLQHTVPTSRINHYSATRVLAHKCCCTMCLVRCRLVA